jgi:hypothetical protein
MKPMDWIREYDIEKEKEMTKLFDSNGEPMLDDPNFLTPMLRKCPLG